MTKKPKFRQCALRRSTDEGEAKTVSYFPEKYAVVGGVLKLKDKGVWTDGWVVESAGELEDEPPDYRKAIRGHRGRTRDDLPKVKDKGR